MAANPPRVRSFALRLAAELGVIVLGITIALWADARVNDRRQREVEAARLEALEGDLTRTLERVQETRAVGDTVGAALRDLVSFTYVAADDSVTLLALRTAFLGVPELQPELNVYDDLRSSGELALFSDAGLRQALSAMQAQIERVLVYQADLLTVQQLNIDPYLMRRFDLGVLMAPLIESDSQIHAEAGQVGVFRDTEVRNLAMFKLDMVTQLQFRLDDVESALISVQQLLSAELEHF